MTAAELAQRRRARYHEALAVVAGGDAARWRDELHNLDGRPEAFARFGERGVFASRLSTRGDRRRPPSTFSPYANASPAADLEGFMACGLAPPDALDPGADRRWVWEKGPGGPSDLPPVREGWAAAKARRTLAAWAAVGTADILRAEALVRVIEPRCVVVWCAWGLFKRVSLARQGVDLLLPPEEVRPDRRRWAEARRHQANVAALRPAAAGPLPPHAAAAGELVEELDVMLVSRHTAADGRVFVAAVVDDHP